ncbi:MAG TPA: cytochrome c oxidase subunit 3 [Gaiellaceae bacterium]|nr:cytochrome c oxidase subunit 3 [Gaiellaceae bacterium]
MTDLAQETSNYSVVEREPPEIMQRNLFVAARLWASSTLFFFFAFLFSYFYLRSLNNHGLWKPKHVDPSQTLGALSTLAVVVTAVLLRWALANRRADNRRAWRQKGGISIVLLIVAIALQIAEWATQSFGPTDGAYASVYLGWTGMEVVFLIGLLYWLETTLATSLRYRKVFPAQFEPGEAAGDPDRVAPDIEDPLSLVPPALEALSFFALFLAGIVVVSWVVLYLL